MGYGTLIRVNKISIKDPLSYQVSISDIDASATRNANGGLVRDRIATKYKIEASWSALEPAEIATLLQAVTDEFFEVEFYNPFTRGFTVTTIYVGDRSSPLAYANDSGEYVWKNLNMNLIER